MNAGLAVSQVPMYPEAGALQDALQREAHLVGDLLHVVLRQRAGVVSDDIQVVDDSVYAAHRMARTLEEARRHRRALLELITGDPDTSLEMLESAMEGEVAPELVRARDELMGAARVLSREIAINRRILRDALSTGEARIRSLCGVPAGANGGGGLLVNRTA